MTETNNSKNQVYASLTAAALVVGGITTGCEGYRETVADADAVINHIESHGGRSRSATLEDGTELRLWSKKDSLDLQRHFDNLSIRTKDGTKYKIHLKGDIACRELESTDGRCAYSWGKPEESLYQGDDLVATCNSRNMIGDLNKKEDCDRVKNKGRTILADTRAKIGHRTQRR